MVLGTIFIKSRFFLELLFLKLRFICKYFFKIQACPNGHLIGDGFCNDVSNNPECNFDGGDCCGLCIVKSQCSQCICIQSEVTVSNTLVGDGYCNDETNNPDCSFDGGDCCGTCVNNEFCSDCQCHLGNLSECYCRIIC